MVLRFSPSWEQHHSVTSGTRHKQCPDSLPACNRLAHWASIKKHSWDNRPLPLFNTSSNSACECKGTACSAIVVWLVWKIISRETSFAAGGQHNFRIYLHLSAHATHKFSSKTRTVGDTFPQKTLLLVASWLTFGRQVVHKSEPVSSQGIPRNQWFRLQIKGAKSGAWAALW